MDQARSGDSTTASSPEFYRAISYKSSFAELWRDARSPLVIILWVSKLIRTPIAGILNDPPVASLEPFVAGAADLPPIALTHLESMQAALKPSGFSSPPIRHYAVDDHVTNSRFYFAILVSDDRRSIARLQARVTAARTLQNARKIVEIISSFADGQILCSTNSHCYQDAPPGVIVRAAVKKKPEVVAQLHIDSIKKVRAAVQTILTDGAAIELADRYHAATINDGLRRGLYRPLDQRERQAADHLVNVRTQARQTSGADADVLVEIERIQQRKSSWGGGVVTLIITIAAFALASKGSVGEPTMIALLIAVLFFHEMGHFITMRAFGYRNVQMFFIPFLGAAVKGQHYNVPGWKKAIVALMGPLPGIVVGIILGLVGVMLHNAILIKVSIIALLLNGSNLLPILPFDGGRVMHALLFTRHWLLDAIFRVVAAGVLIWIGVKLDDRFLMPLGVVMLIAIPANIRTARMTADLRRSGIPTVSPDAQTIPPEVASTIIAKVKSKSRRAQPNQMVAKQVLTIYEMLNARPPNWLASLGLGSLHAVALVAAVFVGLVVAIGSNPELSARLLRRHQQMQTLPLRVDQIALERGAGDFSVMPTSGPSIAGRSAKVKPTFFITANFKDADAARASFDRLRPQLHAGDQIEWFGQTVLLAPVSTDSTTRQRWITLLDQQCDDVFVANMTSPRPAQFKVITHSDATATALANEVGDYVNLAEEYQLIAPWSPVDRRSDRLKAAHRLARRTLQRLLMAGSMRDNRELPELTALNEQMTKAARLGDEEELRKIQIQRGKVYRDLRNRDLAAIAADPQADSQLALIYIDKYADTSTYDESDPEGDVTENIPATATPAELEAAAKAAQEKYLKRRRDMFNELGSRLGQLPGATLPDDRRQFGNSPMFGNASSEGSTVEISLWSLPEPLYNLPTIARWLVTQDCKTLSYNLGTGKQTNAMDGLP